MKSKTTILSAISNISEGCLVMDARQKCITPEQTYEAMDVFAAPDWKPVADMDTAGFRDLWIFDTNEGVCEGFWDPDHQCFSSTEKGREKIVFAVTHIMEYYKPKPPKPED